MRTHLSHLQINVDASNLPFYRDLMDFLGWETAMDTEGMLGVRGPNGESLWFIGQTNGADNDYDGPGVNHIGIAAESQADVDAGASHLAERGVQPLFDTPRHRPDFSQDETQTYYQLMFESPDRVLFELVYTGPKQG